MRIEPLQDRIVVERLEAERVTPGGIHLPEQFRDKPQTGRVIAVGAGTYNEHLDMTKPPKVRVGDMVLFGRYAGDEIKDVGENTLIMRERDVLAIVHE